MTIQVIRGALGRGRPYVVDTGNNRVLIFDQINNTPSSGAHAALILGGLNVPFGINVNPNTGDIWVTELNQSQIRRYPKYDTIIFRLSFDTLPANAPLAVRETLRLMTELPGGDDETGFRESGKAMMGLADTEDFWEGPKAFLEKREPEWKGR